jgi:hypothetical protein
MFCENCGKELENDSQFCIFCGNKTIPPRINRITPDAAPPSPQPVNASGFHSPEDKEFYEKWKTNGRISLRTTDILGFIGVFIFGWLLWIVYDRVGKSAWHIFVPIIFCYVGAKYFFPLVFFGIIIYLWAWSNIRGFVKRYEEIYTQETPA